MNREKEDQLPMMQVGFIDSICLPIYQVSRNDRIIYVFYRLNLCNSNRIVFNLKSWFFFSWLVVARTRNSIISLKCRYCCFFQQAIADLSEKLEPLIEGVRQNKTHWLEESQQTYHPQSHS